MKNLFIISKMMFLRQESKYNGKFLSESIFLSHFIMKKLCFSLVWHEKTWKNGGLSSLVDCVVTPTRYPGSGTSFLRFLEISKNLIFLNRKFYRGNFENVSEITLTTKIFDYNRKLYRNWLNTLNLQVLGRAFTFVKSPFVKSPR